MAEIIAAALPLPLRPDTLLTPVGAAPWRRLRRGLDPAAEIAIALGTLVGLQAAPSLLIRRRSPPQRGRGREERLASPPSFAARPSAAHVAWPVLLIDDVLTTGGTLLACADALEAAGLTVAGGACFAWTPPPSATVDRSP